MKKYNEFITEEFLTIGNDIVFAGKSKYPVGTKIKFKDEGRYLTGTLTHPFAFCKGDVGVYVDQEGVFNYDKVCLKNRDYIVIDEEVDDFLKKWKFKQTQDKYNL
jgi:hypothetical protein